MRHALALLPFAAALALLACDGQTGPVADDATTPPANVVGDGPSATANSAAAEAIDRAALPPMTEGMAWALSSDRRTARFGAPRAAPLLTIACIDRGAIRVVRHHPAPAAAKGTLSLTGAGHAASLPVAAGPTPQRPSEAEWQGTARGDMANAVARPFDADGPVEVSLGGAPSLIVSAGPAIRALFGGCGVG